MAVYRKLSCKIFGGSVYMVKVIANMELNSFKERDRGLCVQVNFHKYKCGT